MKAKRKKEEEEEKKEETEEEKKKRLEAEARRRKELEYLEIERVARRDFLLERIAPFAKLNPPPVKKPASNKT